MKVSNSEIYLHPFFLACDISGSPGNVAFYRIKHVVARETPSAYDMSENCRDAMPAGRNAIVAARKTVAGL